MHRKFGLTPISSFSGVNVVLFDGKWLARDIAEGHEKTSELPDSLRF